MVREPAANPVQKLVMLLAHLAVEGSRIPVAEPLALVAAGCRSQGGSQTVSVTAVGPSIRSIASNGSRERQREALPLRRGMLRLLAQTWLNRPLLRLLLWGGRCHPGKLQPCIIADTFVIPDSQVV